MGQVDEWDGRTGMCKQQRARVTSATCLSEQNTKHPGAREALGAGVQPQSNPWLRGWGRGACACLAMRTSSVRLTYPVV